ncbi:hypothetical protein GCM10027056_04260 [Glaciibacter psychrotolerans]
MFGVGATATLASWNDSETATAGFTAGRFDIVGSVNGGAFGQHGPSAPAALNFPVPVAGMAPGTTSYALFSVKGSATTVAGAVSLAAAATNATSGTGLGAFLTYGVTSIPSGSAGACTATSFAAGATVVAPGSPVTASQPAGVSLPLRAKGATQINYCFAVTLPTTATNDAQGKSAAPVWTFNAVSS